MKKISMFLVLFVVPFLSGCTTLHNMMRANQLAAENRRLRYQMSNLKTESREEISDLEKAMNELSEKLEKEIGDYKAKLEMTERGLVITFVSEIFFDSGKAEIRASGKDSLAKVASVLREDVPDTYVAVEGHTDNDPIRHSGWQSNWELAGGRALAVLHYLVDEAGLSPERLSANSYGEFRPVTSNANAAGKQKNRRVEIVIVPPQVKEPGAF